MGKTAYDFTRYAAAGPHALQRFIQAFELPMPTDCDPSEMLLRLPRADELFKSHENRQLVAGHEAWRRLEWINPIGLRRNFISMFIKGFLPYKLSKEILDSRDLIYSLPHVLPDKFYAQKQCDIELMKPWLLLPLVTVTRVLHIVEARSVPYVFQAVTRYSKDKSKFQYLIWTRRFCNAREAEDPTRLVFAYQTPFTLSEKDLFDFIECTSLPPKDRPADTMPGRYRLWAKIWDACYKNQCRWFVLTSYTHWVFGVFSDSMRTAFVTSIYRASNASPTILELLVYWLASAMGNSSGYIPEETMEPITMEDTPADFQTIKERLSHRVTMPVPAPKSVMSEYAYPDQNDKNFDDPNIDLQSVFDGEGSLCSHYPVQEKLEPALQKWIASNRNAKYRKLDEDDFAPVAMNNVELNNDDIFDPTKGRGDWMI